MSEQPYSATGQGRRLRTYRTSLAGPNAANGGISTIIGRARHAVRNDPWAGTAIDKLVSNGIGTGIQSKQVWGTKEFRKAVDKLWRRWAKYADADGVLDWYGLQALIWREWDEGGECFIRIRNRRREDGLPVPLQIQVIEAEQCPANHWTTAPNGNRIKAGIEFDRIGRRVAYWMYREHPGEQQSEINGSELIRIPADQILHVYEPLRGGQIRGVPRSTSVLLRMHGLDRLDDAVLERQNMANLFGGFYVTKGGAGPVGPVGPTMVDDLTKDEAGTQEKDADQTPLAGLEPGTWQELPEGMEVQFSDPPGAGDTYPDYLRAQLMAIAARHGVPYEVLTGDLRDVSDRALRLILNEFRRTIEMRQWLFLIPQLLQRVRERFMDAAVLDGSIVVAGYAEIRDEVVDALHVPQGWPYSHPVQDVTADIRAIRAGLTSRTETILANGDDPEQIDEQNSADNARAVELGLVYDSNARQVSSAGLTQARQPDSELPE